MNPPDDKQPTDSGTFSPSVSVIIPVHNGERFIEACLCSIQAQTHSVREIIVVDDGSTDSTLEKIPDGVMVLQTGGRKGAGYARNLGAQKAQGEVLFFTDADVQAPPDWVAKGLEIMREHGVACGGGGYAGSVSDAFAPTYAHEELVWRRRHIGGYVQTLVSNNMFCTRELFMKTGGFPETYMAASSEDMEYSWKITRSGQKLWWATDSGVFHNYPDNLKSYFGQQVRFACDAVPMLFRTRGLIAGTKTHHPKSFYAQVFLSGLLVISLPLLAMRTGPWMVLSIAVVWIMMNAGFMAHCFRKQGGLFALRAAGMVLARDMVIIAGAFKGLWLLIRNT